MKLKKYTREDVRHRKAEPCLMRVTMKGSFSFNQAASRDLKIGENSRVFLHQDEERPVDWYLEVTTDEAGITCRRNVKTGSVSFQASYLANELMKSVKITDKSAKFPVSCIPTEGKYFAIITKAAQHYSTLY